MPSHIYMRVGDYALSAKINDQAAAVDRAYIHKHNVHGVYPMMYYSHNMHFAAVAHAMQGRYVDALKLTALAPPTGPLAGGTVVTFTGAGFTGATEVRFGTIHCINRNTRVVNEEIAYGNYVAYLPRVSVGVRF